MEYFDLKWDDQLDELPYLCGQEARRLQGLLSNEIKREAESLLGEGFFVPPTEFLDYAAGVFESLSDRPGAALWSSNPNPRHSAEFICAFAALVQDLVRQADMRAFSGWSMFLESSTLKRAIEVNNKALSVGGGDALVEASAKAFADAKYNWGINR